MGKNDMISVVDSGDSDLELVRVDAGSLVAHFLPGAAGRLLSLCVEGRELLWRNPECFTADLRAVKSKSQWPTPDGTQASWANPGGGKTWPAPQGWEGAGQWAGPPDPILDTGCWSWRGDEEGTVARLCFVSPPDASTGLVISRDFEFVRGSLRISQRTALRCIAAHPVHWAAWEVVQMGTRGRGHVAVVNDPQLPPVVSMRLRGCLIEGYQDGDTWVLPVCDAVAKVIFPGGAGRITYRGDDGAGLSLSYEVAPQESSRYPLQDAPAEVWMQSPQDQPLAEAGNLHPHHDLVEIEALSPQWEIAPGCTRSMAIEWEIYPGIPQS